MLPEQQQRILGYFIEEARDHLNTIEQGLLNLQATLDDPEMINEVFRAAHSIKGGAAMLSLSSIQRTAHRLEDCFKVLKENPITVDQKLESLFLGVSDTLKALLEHLSGPFGLSEEAANNLMSEAEPVFAWLNEHLESLLGQQGGTGIKVSTLGEPEQSFDVTRNVSTVNNHGGDGISLVSTVPSASDWQQFQSQVLQKLRDMLQLFKQNATEYNRKGLSACCEYLAIIGKDLQLTNWCHLCRGAASAITNPDNSYLTLAKVIITEIKAAQELALAGRDSEITISPQLEALIALPDIELLELSSDFFEHQSDNEVADADSYQVDNIVSIHDLNTMPADQDLINSYGGTRGLHVETENINNGLESGFEETLDDINSLFEISDELELDEIDINDIDAANFDSDTIESLFELTEEIDLSIETPDNVEPTLSDNDNINSLFDLTELSSDKYSNSVQNSEKATDDINSPLDMSGFLKVDTTDGSFDMKDSNGNTFSNQIETDIILDSNEPEVGIAELTELDELFKDSVQELDDIADGEQVPQKTVKLVEEEENSTDIGINDSELDDLLVFEDSTNFYERPAISQGELTVVQLFGSFLDDEDLVDDTQSSEIFGDIDVPPLHESISIGDSPANNFLDVEVDPKPDASKNAVESSTIISLEENFNAENPFEQPLANSLDNLFDIAHSPTVTSLSSVDDIFDIEIAEIPSIADFGVNSEDFDEFWMQSELSIDTTLNSEINHSVATELEASLFAATSNHDIFDDKIEAEKLFSSNNIDDSLDNMFEFSSENLLLELGSEQLDVNRANDIIASNTSSQQPELELMPEFTNFSDNKDASKQADNSEPGQDSLNISYEEISISSIDFGDLDEVSFDSDDPENFFDITTNGTTVASEIRDSLPLDRDSTTVQSFDIGLNALIDSQTQSTADYISSDEFAALEAILNDSIPDNKTLDSNITVAPLEGADVGNSINTADSILSLSEFGDLEKMLAEADSNISSSNNSNGNKIQRPATRRTARFEQLMKVPVKHLDDMSNLVGELVVNRNTLEQDQERLRQSLDNLLIQIHHLSDVGARMQELYERSLLESSLLATRKNGLGGSGSGGGDGGSDRGFSELEMDRFTPFHTLSQEMIELIVRVRESASDIDFVTEETERVARQFRQVTTQLQEGLTRARMVPFSQVTDRVKRGVRDNAIKCGKQVELVIEGQDTLIDKMILEHLTDPLIHMLNNAIAHGIETPDSRASRGKPPVGTITVRAFHQGNQTVISVSDDGAGIDAEYVKQKAMKVGLITQEQARSMSRMEVYELLFQPNFSTKDKADDLAGRGVGMDVVRTSISEIRGTITTDSTVGAGTSFTIRLPLTLSICKALCCVWDKARIAFPMDGVEDTLDIPVKSIQKNAEGDLFIIWRDTKLPFKPLKELLTLNRQLSRGSVYGGTRDDDMVSVVVIRSASTLIGLQVDSVLSEQEIVIKQFEGPAPKPIGVAGATVLGDGRIMPIADVLEIIDIFQGRTAKQSPVPFFETAGNNTESNGAATDPTVLIVDDSITVRELLSLSFNKAGYRVEQARDGQEAWEKLRSGLPCDIVFCDIEMPRCDGLELLSRISKEPSLSKLPIAMLTSRGADKHKQMAINLGASGYFTKPYLEEALLEAASRMLKGEKLVAPGNG